MVSFYLVFYYNCGKEIIDIGDFHIGEMVHIQTDMKKWTDFHLAVLFENSLDGWSVIRLQK